MSGTDAEQQSTGKRFGSRLLSAALFLAVGYAVFQLLAPQTIGETARRKFLGQLQLHYPGLQISIGRGSYVTGTGLVFEDVVFADPRVPGPRSRSRRMVQVDRLVVISDLEPVKLLDKQFPLTTRRIIVDGIQADMWIDGEGDCSLTQLFPLPKLGPICPRFDLYNADIRWVDPAGWRRPIEVNLDQIAIRNLVTPGGSTDKQIALVGQCSFADEITAKIRSEAGKTRALVHVTKANLTRPLIDSLPEVLQARFAGLHTLDCVSDVRADLRFQAGGGLDYSTDVKIHSGRLMHAELPFPVSQIRGSLNLTPRGVHIGPSRAMLGDSQVRVRGRTGGVSWPCDVSLDIDAEDLLLDDALASILPIKLRRQWQRLRPQGRVDVRGQLVHRAARWSVAGEVDCNGVDVQYDRFPYPIRQLVGRIQIADDTATSDHLGGRIGAQPLSVAFRLPVRPGESPQRSFAMKMDGSIAMDEELLASLTPLGQSEPTGLERFLRSLHPGGQLQVQRCVLQTFADGTKSRLFDFRVSDGRLRYSGFPLPLHNVNGQIRIRDDLLTLADFSADHSGAGRVACTGTYRIPASGVSGAASPADTLDLNFDVRQVPLDASLRAALPDSARFVWDSVSPGGTLDDLQVRLRQPHHGEPMTYQIVASQRKTAIVTNRSLTIRPETLPYRLDITGGVVTFDGREVLIRSLQARHDASVVSADGRCTRNADGRWVLALNLHSGSRLHPDAELIAALPNEMRAAVRQLQLRGPLSLRGITSITLSDQQNPEPVIDWDLRVQLEGNRIGDVGPVHSLRGELDVEGTRDADRLIAHGRIRIDSMNIYDLQITGLEGPFQIQDDLLLLGRETRTSVATSKSERQRTPGTNNTLRGKMFDGQIEFDGRMLLSSGGFNVGMLVNRASVRTILADLGQANNEWTGELSGRMSLEGILGDVDLLKGEGRARVSGANLYELPLIVQVLGQLRITPTEDVAFTDGDVQFTMFGDQITFSPLQLWGDLVALHGSGSMKRLREVDLTFNTRVSPQNLFSRAIRPLRETPYTLWTIDVKGPIESPTIERRTLDGVGQTLERLFPGISSGRRADAVDGDRPAWRLGRRRRLFR